MANISGPQPEVNYCPTCKNLLRNIPRAEMKSRGHERTDGSISPDTHTYECTEESCRNRFEINQDR